MKTFGIIKLYRIYLCFVSKNISDILKSFRIIKIYRIYFWKIYRIVLKTFRIKKLYRIYFVFLFGIYWIYRRTSPFQTNILSISSDVTPWATPARTARTWRMKSARTAGTTSPLSQLARRTCRLRSPPRYTGDPKCDTKAFQQSGESRCAGASSGSFGLVPSTQPTGTSNVPYGTWGWDTSDSSVTASYGSATSPWQTDAQLLSASGSGSQTADSAGTLASSAGAHQSSSQPRRPEASSQTGPWPA